MIPEYRPPYDSPLEDEFARNFVKYAGDMDKFVPQHEVNTLAGRFVVDFVATVNGIRIGLEVDGKPFHNDARDEWRDAMILGDGLLDTMYRLRGGDLFYHMEDCLYAVSRCDAGLFSERGRVNLETLASVTARNHFYRQGTDRIMLTYPNDRPGDPFFIVVERRSVQNPPGHRIFWRQLHAFALEQGGGPLDELISAYRNGEGQAF